MYPLTLDLNMDIPSLNFIYLGDLTVAAAFESEVEEPVSACFPMTVLIYIEKGNKHYRLGAHEEVFPEGSYILVRKFTDGQLYKSMNPGQQSTKAYAFALTDDYIRGIIDEIDIPQALPPVRRRIIRLDKNMLLDKLLEFLKNCFEEEKEINEATMKSKTKEAITAIIKADPGLAAVFREYTLAQRVDLSSFMNSNFLLKMPLKVFAMQSGRSLSTFHRDFKMIFGETPHRWIMKKRLNHARNLMDTKGLRPSEVYLPSGFEDLAHFSRAFKKLFGYPPSQSVNAVF